MTQLFFNSDTARCRKYPIDMDITLIHDNKSNDFIPRLCQLVIKFIFQSHNLLELWITGSQAWLTKGIEYCIYKAKLTWKIKIGKTDD